MKQYIPILKHTQLFKGVSDEEVSTMMNCLQAGMRTYQKGDYVFRQGEQLHDLMILVEGNLHIQRDDFWGNHSIIHAVAIGEMFGEAYIAPESEPVPNDVIAVVDSVVIFFDIQRILTVCSTACKFHSLVVQNLFFAISERNRQLVQKLGYMSKRQTRQKLIAYLSEEAKRQNSNTFTIPFNRQQLADFLSVDRSAMSNELCKMRDDGLLIFKRNQFTLMG